MEITFQNVTITVSADNPQNAYTKLCEALEPFEYTTDTFTVQSEGVSECDDAEQETSQLFPATL